MIITKIKSGLGNQLFSYAFGRYLSLKYNTTLYLDINWFRNSDFRSYALGNFAIEAEPAPRSILNRVKYPEPNWQLRLKTLVYGKADIPYFKQDLSKNDYELKNLPNRSYIDGLYLSEHYFEEYSAQIKQELSFNSASKNNLVRDLERELENTSSVFVHVRRGDFVKGTWAGHYPLADSYYHTAIDLIKRKLGNPRFYIFSDDLSYVKEKFNIENGQFIDFADNEIDDFRLMTKCNHAIIANSTFSWWAAYLIEREDKIVLAPQKFLETNVVDYSDIYPDTWIQI